MHYFIFGAAIVVLLFNVYLGGILFLAALAYYFFLS
jgi:hypothetical protein